jgi:hypothetical protein
MTEYVREWEDRRRALINEVLRGIEFALQPFANSLDAFLAELFSARLPSDWRERWHAFVAEQAELGFFVEPESAEELETWIDSWANSCGLLPRPEADQDHVGSNDGNLPICFRRDLGHTSDGAFILGKLSPLDDACIRHSHPVTAPTNCCANEAETLDTFELVNDTAETDGHLKVKTSNSSGSDIWWWIDQSLGVIQVPAEFMTGGGDSLTFGVTETVRNWFWGEELSKIQHKTVYRAGEWTEVGIEVMVTGGGALLKRAAAKKIAIEAAEIAARSIGGVTKEAAEAAASAATQRLARGLRKEAREIVDASKDEIVHHVNTLWGHPPYRGRGSVLSEFPTLGVEWLANNKWNLTTIPRNQPGRHIWLHQRAYLAERLVVTATHPALTTGRAASNLIRDGRVEIIVTIDTRK